MAQASYPREILEETLEAVAKAGNKKAAARMLGIPEGTLRSRYDAAVARNIQLPRSQTKSEIELPDFPDDDIPVEDIIAHMARRFEKRQASFDAHTWFPVRIKDDKPIGLLAVGDIHADDNGADWPLILEHSEICKRTPGIHAINIGDSTNCWGGSLIRKYADQDTSVSTARKLVEWLLLSSGIPWLIWLWGNHEVMGDGTALLAQMAKRYGTSKIVMHDWEARFVLNFPNGTAIRVFAAHDHPGNSMWNPLHGQVKAAKFGDADLVVAGHRHNWAFSQWEMAERDTVPLMVRVASYKRFDDYARRKGIIEQREGSSVLIVIDPKARTRSGRMKAFPDVADGADYLTYLRKKEAA